MQQDKEKFLNLKSPPSRLTAEETAWLLGFSVHEIPILMAKGLLKPLGHPPLNGPKFFATAELEERRRDAKWLAASFLARMISGHFVDCAIFARPPGVYYTFHYTLACFFVFLAPSLMKLSLSSNDLIK